MYREHHFLGAQTESVKKRISLVFVVLKPEAVFIERLGGGFGHAPEEELHVVSFLRAQKTHRLVQNQIQKPKSIGPDWS